MKCLNFLFLVYAFLIEDICLPYQLNCVVDILFIGKYFIQEALSEVGCFVSFPFCT